MAITNINNEPAYRATSRYRLWVMMLVANHVSHTPTYSVDWTVSYNPQLKEAAVVGGARDIRKTA